MKNKTIRFSAILMILGVFAVVSFGQKTERVKFAAGATDAALTRTIPANGSIDFIITAKAGQYMDYTPAYDFNKTDIEAFLTEPRLQDVSQTANIDTRNVFRINTSGDHRLTVNNMTRKSITFTLYLQISDTDPDVDTESDSSMTKRLPAKLNTSPDKIPYTTINFKRGAIFSDVSGSLLNYDDVKWYSAQMSGKRGEMMVVDPDGQPESKGIHIKVLDPLGEIAGGDNDDCNNRVEIPQTSQGNYTIIVTQCDPDNSWNGRFAFRIGAGPGKLF